MPTSQLLFISSNQQTTLQFYSDIISSSIFQTPIQFLKKYDDTQLTNYSIVLWSQYFLKEILKSVVKSNGEKLSDIKVIVSKHLQECFESNQDQQKLSQQKKSQVIASISTSLFNRLEEIKTHYLMQTISLGSMYLQDINWKITKTISSSSKSFVAQKTPYLFALTLYLIQNNDRQVNGQSYKVTLEMSKLQLKQFLAQLKTVKSQL